MYSQPDTGGRVVAPSTFKARGDATRWLAKSESDLHAGDLLDPDGGKVAFGQYADQ